MIPHTGHTNARVEHVSADELIEPLRWAADLMHQLRVDVIGKNKKMWPVRWIKHEADIARMRKAVALSD